VRRVAVLLLVAIGALAGAVSSQARAPRPASASASAPRDPLEPARALLQRHRPTDALAALEIILPSLEPSLEPEQAAEGRRLQARALLEAGAPARAIELLLALRAEGPLEAGSERRLGVALVRTGRFADGRQVLEPLERARDLDLDACLCLAIARARTGALADATSLLRLLLADPRAPVEVELELARALLDPTDPTTYSPAEALRHAESVSQRGVACDELLARAYLATGDVEIARALLEATPVSAR
jgi:hypothetical protein